MSRLGVIFFSQGILDKVFGQQPAEIETHYDKLNRDRSRPLQKVGHLLAAYKTQAAPLFPF